MNVGWMEQKRQKIVPKMVIKSGRNCQNCIIKNLDLVLVLSLCLRALRVRNFGLCVKQSAEIPRLREGRRRVGTCHSMSINKNRRAEELRNNRTDEVEQKRLHGKRPPIHDSRLTIHELPTAINCFTSSSSSCTLFSRAGRLRKTAWLRSADV